jgi:predicted HTH transcriptional regulator
MSNGERLVALVDEFSSLDAELPCVEFKLNNFEPDRIGTLISAISNTARLSDQPCGYVIWGIQDGTRDIVGTKFKPSVEKAQGQPMEFWLSTQISPSLHFSFKDVQHAKGRIVLLEIPAAANVPTKFKNIAYIRIGSATPKLADHQAHEASLLSKLRPFVWEQGVAKSFIDIDEIFRLLDISTYFSLTEQPISGNEHEIAQVLAHDKLLLKDVGGRWNILNLGAILFAKNVGEFENIARKAVRVIHYSGQTRTSSAHEQTGVRGYAVGFDSLIDYVNNRLPKREVIARARRTSEPIYPIIAVRELVANALLHQDMTITGTGPVIEIFSDRIEITNPGAPLLETSRFIDLPPRSRNETLAALMRRIGVCEERGSGIDKVIDAIEGAQLPPPEFRADGDSTKVTLFGPKTFADLTPEERVRGCYQHAVLRYVNQHSGMTNASLRERFGVAEKNAAQISRVIKMATEMALIKPSDNWTARSGHYLPFWS